MIKYENECVNCGIPLCLGESCPNQKVIHYYCDECYAKDEDVDLYYFEDQHLCLNCIEKQLEKIT